MKRHATTLGLTSALGIGLVLGYAFAQTPPAASKDAVKPPEMKLADTPASVQAAITKLTGEKNIKKISKETEHGMTVFEVEYEVNGKPMSADLTDKGETLALEGVIDVGALPAAVSAAIKKSIPNGVIQKAESVQEFYYEARVMSEGKTHEVKVTAAGEIKSKGGQHEEDENDEDGDKD